MYWSQREETSMGSIAFDNARVFDGITPRLLPGRSVLVEDGLISKVGETSFAAEAEQVVDCKGRILMPGLIDLHVHIWAVDMNVAKVIDYPSEYVALFAASSLQGSLDRGFTSLRDAGGTDAAYALAIERGLVKAPRFFHSGRFISQTGGHGDFRTMFEQPNDCLCCPPR